MILISVCPRGEGGLCMMSLSVWLPGPNNLQGGLCCWSHVPSRGSLSRRSLYSVGSLSRGVSVGRPPRIKKSGGTHPTGMLSCFYQTQWTGINVAVNILWIIKLFALLPRTTSGEFGLSVSVAHLMSKTLVCVRLGIKLFDYGIHKRVSPLQIYFYRPQGEGNIFTGVRLSTIGLMASRLLLGFVRAPSVRILLEYFFISWIESCTIVNYKLNRRKNFDWVILWL